MSDPADSARDCCSLGGIFEGLSKLTEVLDRIKMSSALRIETGPGDDGAGRAQKPQSSRLACADSNFKHGERYMMRRRPSLAMSHKEVLCQPSRPRATSGAEGYAEG